MHVDDLRTVRLIAELGSFSAAGAYLEMTQSAVSHRIRQVERELGFAVFVREGRGIRLTPAGEELAGIAQDIEGQLLRLRRKFAMDQAVEGLLLGTPAGPAFVLPHILADFFERYPGPSARMVTLPPDQIRAGLLRGDLDFGILDAPYLGGGIVGELQSHSSWVLVAPSSHPVLAGGAPSVRDIARHPFVIDTSRGERGVAQSWAATQQVSLRPVLEVDTGITVLAAVSAGIGLGFASELSVSTALSHRLVEAVPAPGTPVAQNVYLAYCEHHPHSSTWAALLQCFRDGRWRKHEAMEAPGVRQPIFPWDCETAPGPAKAVAGRSRAEGS